MLRPATTRLEIPHDGLTRNEEFVHEDVPRAHRQSSGGGQGADPLLVLGPHFEVIVHHGHLPVEEEAGVGGVGLEQGDECVEHPDQAQPEALVRLVPLPVPVGMGDDGDVSFGLVACWNARAGGTHHPAPIVGEPSAVVPSAVNDRTHLVPVRADRRSAWRSARRNGQTMDSPLARARRAKTPMSLAPAGPATTSLDHDPHAVPHGGVRAARPVGSLLWGVIPSDLMGGNRSLGDDTSTRQAPRWALRLQHRPLALPLQRRGCSVGRTPPLSSARRVVEVRHSDFPPLVLEEFHATNDDTLLRGAWG